MLKSSCIRPYTPVFRAHLPCPHKKCLVFRGTLKLKISLNGFRIIYVQPAILSWENIVKVKTGFSLGLLIGMIAWGFAGSGIQEAAADGQICPDGSILCSNGTCADNIIDCPTSVVCPADKMLCPNGTTCADNFASCPTESNTTTSTGSSPSPSTSGYTAMKRCYVGCRARGGKKCIKTRTGQLQCVGGKFPPR